MSKVNPESSVVQSHLSIMQDVINRMASNSTGCKTWCITLVSAILIVIADKSKPQYTWIALIPSLLFLILDAYYLGLEKGFRNSYNTFIDKLHNDTITKEDMYAMQSKSNMFQLFLKAVISFSVWPFYLTLIAMIALVEKYII